MAFYIRSETDDHDRKVISAYVTECYEVWIARVTQIGDRPWIQFNGPIASPQTLETFQEVLRWAKQFTLEDQGPMNFNICWVAQPLEHTVAKKVTGWEHD